MPEPSERLAAPLTPSQGILVPSSSVRVDVAALSHQGHVREINEDSYVVYRIGRYLEPLLTNIPQGELPPAAEDIGYVMMVADGLGGHEAGEVASRTALITSLELVLRSPNWALKLDDPATRERQIQELVGRSKLYLGSVHEHVRDQAESHPELAGMGTTLTGAYSVGFDLFVLHVGDSRAYLARQGRLRKITHDHTVAQGYADAGVIAQQEVEQHRLQHVLTRAVGGPDRDLEGDMHHIRLLPGDRLLLCSDGLTDMASEQEIADLLQAGGASESACQALVALALAKGGRDNVTAIVASYELMDPPAAGDTARRPAS